MTTPESKPEDVPLEYVRSSDQRKPYALSMISYRQDAATGAYQIRCAAGFVWAINDDEARGAAHRKSSERWPASYGWNGSDVALLKVGLTDCEEIARMVGEEDAAEMPAPSIASENVALSPSVAPTTRETVILRARQLLSAATRGPWFLKDGQVHHNGVSRGYLDSLTGNEENNNAFLSNVHELLIQLIDLDSHSYRQIAGLVEKLAETEEKLKISDVAFRTMHDKAARRQLEISRLEQNLEAERKRSDVAEDRLAHAEAALAKVRAVRARWIEMFLEGLEEEIGELAVALEDVPEETKN